MGKQWYALRVKPNREKTVNKRLSAAEVEHFLPLVRVHPTNPRAAKWKPYFPGYLFVRADLAESGSNTFNWMPGAIGLVAFGGVAAVVPDNLIYELDRLVKKINESGGLERYSLRAGDRVRIVKGPFAGYEAIFDAHLPEKDRVQVLLAFLSQSPHRLELDAEAVRKIEK